MKVRLAPRALQRARHIKRWWQNNRPGAEAVFEHELERMTRKLATMSPQGPLGVVHEVRRGKTIRRVLLPRSQQHVYYSVDEASDTVVIRTIWGARRGRRPRL